MNKNIINALIGLATIGIVFSLVLAFQEQQQNRNDLSFANADIQFAEKPVKDPEKLYIGMANLKAMDVSSTESIARFLTRYKPYMENDLAKAFDSAASPGFALQETSPIFQTLKGQGSISALAKVVKPQAFFACAKKDCSDADFQFNELKFQVQRSMITGRYNVDLSILNKLSAHPSGTFGYFKNVDSAASPLGVEKIGGGMFPMYTRGINPFSSYPPAYQVNIYVNGFSQPFCSVEIKGYAYDGTLAVSKVLTPNKCEVVNGINEQVEKILQQNPTVGFDPIIRVPNGKLAWVDCPNKNSEVCEMQLETRGGILSVRITDSASGQVVAQAPIVVTQENA